MQETSSIRTSFLVVSLLSLVWMVVAWWAIMQEGRQPTSMFQAVQVMGLLLTPVAAMFALAAALGNRELLPTLRAPDSIEDTEARLAGTLTRIEALKASLAEELQSLDRASEALETRAADARDLIARLERAGQTAASAARALDESLPDAARRADAMLAALDAADARARELAAHAAATAADLLARSQETSAAQQAALEAMAAGFARLEQAATDARARSEDAMRVARGDADRLFELIENGIKARQDALARHGATLAASLEEGYARLERLAGGAHDATQQRLATLSDLAGGLGAQLEAQREAVDTLARSGEKAFQLLDARLQHSGETSRAALDRIAVRVQEVGQAFGQLTRPIRETQGAAVALDEHVAALTRTAKDAAEVLGEVLPARGADAASLTATLREEVGALVAALEAAGERAAALSEPLAAGREDIARATALFAEQRAAIEAAGQGLVAELEAARGLISDVEEQTRDTSLQAATRLVDAMTRVREVAGQATGTMREMLDQLIGEAQQSLAAAADTAMRQHFLEPVATRAQEAEAAASRAAERTAGSMAQLASSLKLVEDRLDARLAELERANEAELLSAAALLSERLSSDARHILEALDRPMSDADWAAWRKGERGLFLRRSLGLLNRRETGDLKRTLVADPAALEAARRYVSGFDALIARFEQGVPALAAALRNSDHGRLAAALSDALD